MRRRGSGELNFGGGKTPATTVPLAVASGNQINLTIGGALKVKGKVSGSSTIEGSAKRTADEIAKQLQVKFEEKG